MDEALRDAAANDWRESYARSVQAQRQKSRESLAASQARLRELEGGLQARLEELARQLAEQQDESQQSAAKLATREAALTERKSALDVERTARLTQLADRQKLLDAADRELQAKAAALAERETALGSKASDLAKQEAAIDKTRHEQETRGREHQEQLADLCRQQGELETQRAELATRQRETQRQRRHIAQQLRAQRQELTSEADLHRAESLASASGQELQLQVRLSELQGKYEKLRDELSLRESERANSGEKLAELAGQLAARQQELAQQHTATEQAETQRRQLQAQIQQLEEELAVARSAPKVDDNSAAVIKTLRAEVRELEQLLSAAEKKAGEAAQAGGPGSQEFDDLRRRFEMALQDLREHKTKNAELSEQLAKTNDQLAKARKNPAPASGGAAAGGALDWESQKRRLLEQLESDFDDADAKEQEEKLTVQGAIKITDEVVAERDKEILELRQLLQNQSQNVGDVAVGAAAIAQILDHDELLTQQRERVQQLETSLREQLKKAEVDISVERAKVARERAELEEKLRQFDAERAKHPEVADASTGAKGKSPPQARGKWLARLGLGEGKDG